MQVCKYMYTAATRRKPYWHTCRQHASLFLDLKGTRQIVIKNIH